MPPDEPAPEKLVGALTSGLAVLRYLVLGEDLRDRAAEISSAVAGQHRSRS